MNLKEYRQSLGLTQKEAAKLTYCSPRTWQKYENEELKTAAEHNAMRARTELLIWKVLIPADGEAFRAMAIQADSVLENNNDTRG